MRMRIGNQRVSYAVPQCTPVTRYISPTNWLCRGLQHHMRSSAHRRSHKVSVVLTNSSKGEEVVGLQRWRDVSVVWEVRLQPCLSAAALTGEPD